MCPNAQRHQTKINNHASVHISEQYLSLVCNCIIWNMHPQCWLAILQDTEKLAAAKTQNIRVHVAIRKLFEVTRSTRSHAPFFPWCCGQGCQGPFWSRPGAVFKCLFRLRLNWIWIRHMRNSRNSRNMQKSKSKCSIDLCWDLHSPGLLTLWDSVFSFSCSASLALAHLTVLL